MEELRSKWWKLCEEYCVHCEEMSLDISEVKFAGRGFFPGADGRWNLRTNSSELEVLVLGQDFGTLGYAGKGSNNGDESCPTWRVLMKFLSETATPVEKCFFSNCYIGYRHAELMAGALAIAENSTYDIACMKFLEFQISEINPKIILTLGRDALAFVSRFSSGKKIARTKSWKKIEGDLSSNGCIDIEIAGSVYKVFPMIHPSIRASNLRHRYSSERNLEEKKFRQLVSRNVAC